MYDQKEDKKEGPTLEGRLFDLLLVTVVIVFPTLLMVLTWKYW